MRILGKHSWNMVCVNSMCQHTTKVLFLKHSYLLPLSPLTVPRYFSFLVEISKFKQFPRSKLVRENYLASNNTNRKPVTKKAHSQDTERTVIPISTRNFNHISTRIPVTVGVKRKNIMSQNRIRQGGSNKSSIPTLPFKCNLCGNNFAVKYSLARHTKMHLGISRYVCTMCDKQCSSLNFLENHVRTHTRERPFNCEYCEKDFSSTGSLLEHVRIHTGDKPFKCHMCSKSFITRRKLKCHSGVHLTVKLYKCKYCGARLGSKLSLTEHERKLHKSEGASKITTRGICQSLKGRVGLPRHYENRNRNWQSQGGKGE